MTGLESKYLRCVIVTLHLQNLLQYVPQCVTVLPGAGCGGGELYYNRRLWVMNHREHSLRSALPRYPWRLELQTKLLGDLTITEEAPLGPSPG